MKQIKYQIEFDWENCYFLRYYSVTRTPNNVNIYLRTIFIITFIQYYITYAKIASKQIIKRND